MGTLFTDQNRFWNKSRFLTDVWRNVQRCRSEIRSSRGRPVLPTTCKRQFRPRLCLPRVLTTPSADGKRCQTRTKFLFSSIVFAIWSLGSQNYYSSFSYLTFIVQNSFSIFFDIAQFLLTLIIPFSPFLKNRSALSSHIKIFLSSYDIHVVS